MAVSSAGTRYVCWEWMRDDMLGFSPYNPEDSYLIERSYCTDRRCKVKLTDSEVDLKTKSDSRGHSVRRNTSISLPHQDLTAYWLWCSMAPSTFVCYDIAAIADIEKGYMDYLNGTGKEIVNLSNCPCHIPYTINYANMNQTRHRFMTVRNIKRVQLTQGQTLQFLLRAQDTPPTITPLHPTSSYTSSPYGASSLASMGATGGAMGYSSGTSYGATGGATGYSFGTTLAATKNSHGAMASLGGTATSILKPSVLSGHHGNAIYGNPVTSLCPNCSGSTCICSHMTKHSASLQSGTTRSGKRYAALTTPPSTAIASTAPVVTSVSSTTKSSRSRRKAPSGKTSPTTGRKSPPSTKSTRKKSGKRGKKKAEEEEEEEEECGTDSGKQDLMIHFKKVKKLKKEDDEPCPICMNQLSEQSGFDDDEDDVIVPTLATPSLPLLYKLRKCGHKMHNSCLRMYLKSQGQANGFQCPTCKLSYGVKTGDMPDGTMTVRKSRTSLPGHSGFGTVEIIYNFSPGKYNGVHYRANGFPRVCYLPDSPKGKKVLKLLKVAWARRLTFTIGTSVTTGASDTVVWNEIHHKTESTSNHSGHGYPDPGYLDRVLMELAAQGVSEEDQNENGSKSSSEDSDA